MTAPSRSKLITYLGAMSECFGTKFSETMGEIYWQALKDLPRGYIHQACQDAVRDAKWMPKASELRERAEKLLGRHRALQAPPPPAVEDTYEKPDLAAENPFEVLAREWEKNPPKKNTGEIAMIRKLIGLPPGDRTKAVERFLEERR